MKETTGEPDVTIVDYMTSKEPLEKREQVLFDLIDEMENETNTLFNEAINLKKESIYQLFNLLFRCKLLTTEYQKLTDCYNYINKIEESSYSYAAKRYELKMLLTITVTVYAFLANSLLGIVSYVALSESAKKYFLQELEIINENLKMFDDERIRRIGTTLSNSTRIVEGKYKELQEHSRNNKEYRDRVVEENKFILSVLEGTKDLNDFNNLPDDIKNDIIELLISELNCENKDISELFDILKKERKTRCLELTIK